jgi:hypothetical protein
MVMSSHQNVGQNHNSQIYNKCFENLGRFNYLRMTVKNQNCILEEITSRIFGSKGCKGAKGWRELHDNELCNL